jgi:mannose/fructose/N-acetylgalactosamine-specific phosphotransferase system component IIC
MQKADAQVGAVLLTIGFAGQFASTLAWNPSWATTRSAVIGALLIVAVGYAILFRVVRPAYVREAVARIPPD